MVPPATVVGATPAGSRSNVVRRLATGTHRASGPSHLRCAKAWLCAALLLGACAERPAFVPGEECELNTECAAPLVCRLGRCRVECRAQRDCAAGLECVRDELGLGACQLPDETDCTLTSDCPEPLVCHFRRCTNECASDRDCPPGAHCIAEEGVHGCRDESVMECTLHSDCTDPRLICAVDGRCREPCREDWDCSDGRRCLDEGGVKVCGWPDPPNDGGVGDGGTVVPPPPPRLAAGLRNTCAAASGAPRCWGDNDSGQIGDGTTTDRLVPTPVVGIAEASVLEVGHAHACAVTPSGLLCWGDNSAGQLGRGSTTPAFSSTPAPVVGLPSGPIRDVALGLSHTCAIVEDALYCWGSNADGQLGLGDTVARTMPTLVSGLDGRPTDVDAFSVHTCVLLEDGRLACFGENGDGQLGRGDRNDATAPVIASLTDVVEVATGATHTCAIRRDGSVWCWGANFFGQVGAGSGGETHYLVPKKAAVPGLALELAAGSAHSCARTASAVYCWGYNFAGQAGQPESVPIIDSPTAVATLGVVDEIAAGSDHTCVRVSGTTHRCFGTNLDGQLGTGSSGSSSWMPADVIWP